MLIKKTYELIGGVLYNLYVIFLKADEICLTYPSDVKSLEKTKNGNKLGSKTLYQTLTALRETLMYFCGVVIIKIRTKKTISDKIIFFLKKIFDKIDIILYYMKLVGSIEESIMKFTKNLLKLAKQKQKTIVFPESAFSDRIIKAVLYIQKHKIANVILIGDESSHIMQNKKLKNFKILNPKTFARSEEMVKDLYELRKDKGVSFEQAKKLILDPFYFSTMLVKKGYADGMVGGAEVSTAKNLKPALQILKNGKDNFVNSYVIMVGKNKITDNPFFLTDCGLLENPSSNQLAIMAERVCGELKKFTSLTPKVAFLSYSTKGSAESDTTLKVKEAYNKFSASCPNVLSQGEIQLDAALIERVARTKLGDGAKYYGKSNVLVFPELNSANIGYKAISYFGNLYAIGPITVGLEKPVNDLSRGATVKDIIYLTAITVLQCD